MLTAALITFVCFVASVEHPDFSGEWIYNRARSTLQVAQLASLESATVRIEHHEPAFRLWRRFVLAGQTHEVAFELTTDGTESESRVGDQHRLSRLTWDADTLVFTTRIEGPAGAGTNMVRYSLLDDGTTLRALESFRGSTLSYENVWVFKRR